MPSSQCRLKYRILSATSTWKEGLAIRSDVSIEFDDGQSYGKEWVIVFWEGEPIEQEFVCRSKKRILDVKNVWDIGTGCIDSWSNNAAMWFEEIDGGFRYHCNDARYDEDFDDIVFEIIILE